MNMKQWIVAFFALLIAVGTSSCKDELTLSEAGDEVYITITPSNPTIVYGGEPLVMQCEVVHLGKPVTDAAIEWTSDDPTVARFVEGNKIVAEHAGIGRETKVRAKLNNGKYAITTVKVTSTKAESLELLIYNVSTSKKKEKIVNPETGVEEEKEVESYSVTKSFIGEHVVIPMGGTLDFVVEAKPAGALKAGDIEVLGIDGALCEVAKLELDKELDKDKIAVTPEGAVWYRARSLGVRGVANLTFRAPGKGAKEVKLAMNFGTRLEKIGFNKAMDVVETSDVLDIKQEVEVQIFAEVLPALDEDLEVIKKTAEWSITDVRGGGGNIIEEPTVIKGEGQAIILKTKAKAGLLPGNFTLRCTLQGKTLAKTFTVINKANIPFEKITFEGEGFDDLYAGETKQLRIRILPLSSLVHLHPEMKLTYSVPDIVDVAYNDGLYSVSGKKAGQTELIATLRGKEYRLPITVKPAPRSVLIDSHTPNVLMLGDEVAWSAQVQMEGGDTPVWSSLKWTIADAKYASFVGAASGQSVRIKALELTDGVNITADYRGKKNDRVLRVVPVQESVALADANINAGESGVTIDNGAVKLELVSKNVAAQPSLNIVMRPKAGAPAIEAKSYTGASHDIEVVWSSLNLRKAAVQSSSVTLVKAGSKWNATVNITMTVAGKTITVTGSLTDLEQF